MTSRQREIICQCSRCGGHVKQTVQTAERHRVEDRQQQELEDARSRLQASQGSLARAPTFPATTVSRRAERAATTSAPDAMSSDGDYSTLQSPRDDITTTLPPSPPAAADHYEEVDFQTRFSDLIDGLATSRPAVPFPAHPEINGWNADDPNSGDEEPEGSEPEEESDNEQVLALDVEADPNYVSREELYNADSVPNEDLLPDGEPPPAFDEDPILRNIYIRILVQASFKGASHDSVRAMLRNERATLLALQARGLLGDLDLTKFATTLPTIERRLGVTPDSVITYYFLCPVCWSRHHPKVLPTLLSPVCGVNECDGVLYTTNGKRNGSGKEQRTPSKVMPYTSLEGYVRRMMLRPGKAEEMDHWRTDDDHGDQPPISRRQWAARTGLDTPLHDVHDGYAWRQLEADLKRTLDYENTVIRDERTTSPPTRFVSKPLGLLFTINVDWLQPMKSRIHSTGAVYVIVDNLPRQVRFLRQNTFLLCVIPGPSEPSKEQMNVVTELVVDEIKKFSKGIDMPVLRSTIVENDDSTDSESSSAERGSASPRPTACIHQQVSEEKVNGQAFKNCSDTPARAKTSGFAGGDEHMCPICHATLPSITSPECFDPQEFKSRDPHEQQFWKLGAKYVDQAHRNVLAQATGLRWAPPDDLPGWLASRCSPTEPMHCLLLGTMADVHKTILVSGGMFVGSRKKGAPQPTALYESFLASVWWPHWVSRIPPKLNKGNGKIKADQWRSLLAIYPVALFMAWRDEDDEIPDKDAPRPRKNENVVGQSDKSNKIVRKRKAKHAATQALEDDMDVDSDDADDAEMSTASRNFKHHFQNVLSFITGVRIFLTWTITRNEAARAERFLGKAFRAWARMGCHLKPNFHASLHIRYFIERYGPVYGWWAYAFERMNGILARFRTNGKLGGELEATLLRSWIKLIMLQDLLKILQDLPNKTDDDLQTIDTLLQAMKGGGEGELAKGTFMTYLASINSSAIPDGITLPPQSYQVDLHALQIYPLVLQFVQASINRNIVSFATRGIAGQAPYARLTSKFKAYNNITVAGLKYGGFSRPLNQRSCYGYIQGRRAVRIEHIIHIGVKSSTKSKEDKIVCAVVRPFRPALGIKNPPWHDYATDLGIALWHDNDLGDLEVVPVTQFSGHFAWAPIAYQGLKLRVTCSLDHRGQEPDEA